MSCEAWTDTFLRRIKGGRIHRYRYADILRVCQVVETSGGGKRSVVSDFSKASARRFRLAYETRPEQFTQFVTLTFPREIFKDQSGLWQMQSLKNFSRIYWQEARKIGATYLWVAEPQKDGTPHFHILTNGHGEEFVWLWKWLVWCHLGYRHEDFERHGTDVRPITTDQINAYLAKTSRYLVKGSNDEVEHKLLNGWRRWGRNYKSEPYSVEDATAADVSIALYATALQYRPNALTTWLVCDTGVLVGAGSDQGEDPHRHEVPNVYACQLDSGGRTSPHW